ncbi:Putative tyrosinase copper-binding domain, di-copper centre-containing domain superfamily [Colletotrichum destructivum]|uniref:Tyrosinase copper-binding domain, di-copper centre-containing domain superfamily n=1 Tax=Colletotrichum destructivum TaxID=34406 RepID=A0AAX4IJG7_9PEZI|nr:Putative tyrosinase copper-binding domain, di-copper centre-containing domain superfamily [Colletotrichum destructivum]
MFLLSYNQARYVALRPPHAQDNDIEDPESISVEKRTNITKRPSTFVITIFCLFFFATGFLCGEFIQEKGLISKLNQAQNSRCQAPSIRREWRSLSSDEKTDYISAVRCLLSKPSKVPAGTSLYHDFPRLHSVVGGDSHNTALFLPWHRYLLHVYENELRSTCGYNGSLTYWDWSLDWESLADSPVFSNTTGFGGNGDSSAPESVGGGYCVTDGPFSDLELDVFGLEDDRHCLSRGFTDGKVLGRLNGDKVKPAVIEEILRQPDYASFFVKLEDGPHNQIPNGIQGDFIKFTAPNDPLFFLHHSQLDRLWWMWQQRNLRPRLSDYGEIKKHEAVTQTSLSDAISIGGIMAPDIHVSDVMSTESDLLCYRY